ncbi:MAG: histidine phosphatase family protein [Flavobacteriales bacterium]
MKRVTLIRHAKSDWGNPDLKDFDRPLNKRGLRDAPAMAKYYKETSVTPDVIVSSPALRAQTTALFFLEEFNITPEHFILESAIYEASPDTLMEIISKFHKEWNHVLMFGHNPGFSYLANELTLENYNKVTCSISEIELYVEDWNLVSRGTGKMTYSDYPKTHPELQ